jgi:ribosome maturation factor RimP
MEIRNKVIALVEPVLAEQGLELVDVEHRREGRGQVVRLLVDRKGGVDLDTLSRLSRELSVLLDVEEPVPGSYALELSSPGIHRPLRKPEHFVPYLGKRVRIRSRVALDGQRNFCGTLATITGGGVTLRLDGGSERTLCVPMPTDGRPGPSRPEGAKTEIYIEFSNIEKANYEHEFSAADFGKRAVPR